MSTKELHKGTSVFIFFADRYTLYPVRAFHHHYRSSLKRGLFSLILIIFVMIAGTFGMHRFEGLSYLDAFYFMSMLATAQGSTYMPVTASGKIFAAIIAFISVGSVVAALGFLFGPFFGQLWKVGVEKMEEELSLLHKKNKP